MPLRYSFFIVDAWNSDAYSFLFLRLGTDKLILSNSERERNKRLGGLEFGLLKG